MDKYSTLFQVFAILFILFLIYLLYRFIVTTIKKNRLSYYSINNEKDKYEGEKFLFKFIYRFSDILKTMVVFNNVARTYDKYCGDDSNMKKGMDYISVKIILGVVFILLYLFIGALYKDKISSLVIFICFIIGFILVDFYCIYLESKNRNILSKDILGAIIIMNNSYKANRSTEQAIVDVIDRATGPVAREFKKVLNDIKLGLSIDESFRRMYFRTNVKIIEEVSVILSLMNKTGANKVEIFDEIEKKLLDEEKFNGEIEVVKRTNKLSMIVFMILPLLFIVYSVLFSEKNLALFISDKGILATLILSIMYIFYLIVIFKIVRMSKNDR